MMRELKISALAPNLRANEQTCPVLFSKEGRIAIPLQQSQPLMENSGGNFDLTLEALENFFRELARMTNEEDFLLFQFLQQRNQPGQLGGGFIWRRSKRDEVGFPLGKTAEGRSGISKHHPTGAVFIQKGCYDLVARCNVPAQKCFIMGCNAGALE